MNRDIIVSVKELVYRILKKWKYLIVAAILGAVIFDVLGVYIAYTDYKDKQPIPENVVNEYKNGLSENEQEEVNQAFEAYKVYKRQYDENVEYINNSILMNMNVNNAITVQLNYYFDNKFELVYPVIDKTNNINDVMNAFVQKVTSDDTINKIKEKLDYDIDNKYLKELIAANSSQADQTLTIWIYANTDELAEKISEVINTVIEDYISEAKGEFGEFEVSNTGSDKTMALDQYVKEYQQNQIVGINNLKESIQNVGDNLDNSQKEYYDILVKNNENVSTEFKKQYIKVKYIVLGILCGIIFITGIIVLRYILQKSIRNVNDLHALYDLYNIGVYNKAEDKDINKFAKQIIVMAKKNNINQIALISSAQSSELYDVIQKLKYGIKDTVKSVYVGMGESEILECVDKLEKMDGVIFIEEKNVSTYLQVEQNIKICTKCNLNIIGNIMVE